MPASGLLYSLLLVTLFSSVSHAVAIGAYRSCGALSTAICMFAAVVIAIAVAVAADLATEFR